MDLAKEDITKSPSEMSWLEGQQWCNQRGLELVSMHSEKESNAVYSKCGEVYSCWIGLNCIDREHGDWQWTDGTPFDEADSNWISGEPRNSGLFEDCVQIRKGFEGRWNDIDCDGDADVGEGTAYALCYKVPTVAPTKAPSPLPTYDPTKFPSWFPSVEPTGTLPIEMPCCYLNVH